MKQRKIMDTSTLAKAGFLTALSIVLTRFFYFFLPIAGLANTLRISFGELPIMVAGLLFGPIVGGISGVAADAIGVLINSQGAFHPGFTLSSMLWGVIPGLLGSLYIRNRSYKEAYSFKNVFLAVSISFIVISIGLNTLWLSTMMGKGYIVLLPGRAIGAIVNIPIQSIIMTTLLKHLKSFAKM